MKWRLGTSEVYMVLEIQLHMVTRPSWEYDVDPATVLQMGVERAQAVESWL